MPFFRRPAVTSATSAAQAFRNNRQLQQFFLTGVTPTGRVLGTGAYGSVEEVTYKHITCAGKKFHEVLIEAGNDGVDGVVHKYLQECQLMSNLRHPNITQFLGLCFLPGTQLPLLVMERLETSLDDLLEHIPNLPLSLKRSVLEDIASGLLYLHDRPSPVIHRDLTAANVLLTSSLVAKIADVGESHIVDMRAMRGGQIYGQMDMDRLPGTLAHLPPEALDDTYHYGPSLDVFSYGNLALYTLIQKFPGDLLPSTFYNLAVIQARTEVERRGEYIELLEGHIGVLYPNLVQLVKQCLQNAANQRPSTEYLLTTLQGMKVEVEGGYGSNPVQLDMVRVRLAKEVNLKERKIQELTRQQEFHKAELQQTTREATAEEERDVKDRHIQELQAEILTKDEYIQQKDQQLRQKDQQLQQLRNEKDQELQQKDQELQQLQDVKDQQLQQKDQHLQQLQDVKNQQLQQKDQELQQLQDVKDQHLQQKDQQVQQLQNEKEQQFQQKENELVIKNEQIQHLQNTIKALVSDLQLREARLKEELQSREDEISQLKEDLQTPPPLQFSWNWRCGPDLQYETWDFVQSVVLEKTVYIGGGFAHDDKDNRVMAYNTFSEKWTTLPPYRAHNFAMTAINNQLMLVGGSDCLRKIKALGVWAADSKQWTHPYPDMQAARIRCSAVVYNEWLVVAGGKSDKHEVLSSVEVMHIGSKQWYAGPSLPIPWESMRSAVVSDVCYFMGGCTGAESCRTDKVYAMSLSALIIGSGTPVWKEISGLKVTQSTPLSMNGSLLAVGGWDMQNGVTAINNYQSTTGEWVKVGDLPTPRWNCTCAMTTSREMLVAGGWNEVRVLKRVDMALIS